MGKTRIRDMKDNKNINIKKRYADEFFKNLGIDPKVESVMDVKRAIFKLYGISDPKIFGSEMTLSDQKPNNAFGIRITNIEMHKFMELFHLTGDDWFQEGIGDRIVKDVLQRRKSPKNTEVKVLDAAVSDRSERASLQSDEEHPEEIDPNETMLDGAKRQVTINAFERNAKARRLCVEKYGYRCAACEFSFDVKYGEIGRDFIHVHHRVELSIINSEYEVDPILDLIPVCPNCHAMLHKRKPAYSIDELRKIIAQRAQ